MRRMFFLIVTLSILLPSTISARATEQLAIGVFDIIISRTEFNVETCEAYSCDAYVCNFASKDNTTQMELKRATIQQHVEKDLNFLLDIEFDSKLFKSGLLVQYYNDINLIRVYLKGAGITVEATRKDEIASLQNWLKKVLKLVK